MRQRDMGGDKRRLWNCRVLVPIRAVCRVPVGADLHRDLHWCSLSEMCRQPVQQRADHAGLSDGLFTPGLLDSGRTGLRVHRVLQRLQYDVRIGCPGLRVRACGQASTSRRLERHGRGRGGTNELMTPLLSQITFLVLAGTVVAGCGGSGSGRKTGTEAGAGGDGAVGGSAGQGAGRDGDSCRADGQTCSSEQGCCAPLICTGLCTAGVTPVDSGRGVDASDAAADANRSICAKLTSLVLSNPMVISGSVTGGQTVTLQITLTDTDPNGWVSYPYAVLTSSTPGVTFTAENGPAGADIEGGMSKSITFSVTLAPSIPSGTAIQISARPVGEGHIVDDCNATVLSFTLTTI